MGLTVLLNVNVNEYYCSTTNSAGFKVQLEIKKKKILKDIYFFLGVTS